MTLKERFAGSIRGRPALLEWRAASGHFLLVCFALVVSVLPQQVCAQFTDPRNYENSPIGGNQLEFAHAFARADSLLDPALVIAGARLNLNQGIIGYTRYFGLFHRMAWVEPSIPIAVLNGSISGPNSAGSIAGFGDSSYEMAVLLKGGAAMTPEEFKQYKPTTTMGVSLTVTAPTGQYSPDKTLNLGEDRWSLNPEVAVSCPF